MAKFLDLGGIRGATQFSKEEDNINKASYYESGMAAWFKNCLKHPYM